MSSSEQEKSTQNFLYFQTFNGKYREIKRITFCHIEKLIEKLDNINNNSESDKNTLYIKSCLHGLKNNLSKYNIEINIVDSGKPHIYYFNEVKIKVIDDNNLLLVF